MAANAAATVAKVTLGEVRDQAAAIDVDDGGDAV